MCLGKIITYSEIVTKVKCELEKCSFDANEYVQLCKTHHEGKLEELCGMSFRKIRVPILKNA